jgi:mono/diheme cytochrome c family protein
MGVAALLAPPAPAAKDARIAQGHALAVERCSRCHSVEAHGRSPNPTAPPFRTLGHRYPVEDLDEALAEGIMVGHANMPSDPWEPADIERFIAYLKSINRAPKHR